MDHRPSLRFLRCALVAGSALFSSTTVFGTNEEVADRWQNYIKSVACRSEVDVIACYVVKIRDTLSADNVNAGHARLEVHMGDLFELLCRDYDYNVVKEEERGGKVLYTIHFKHKKKGNEHTTMVEFTEEDGRWLISQPPEPPSFFKAGKGTFNLIAGIVVGAIVLILIGKKFLA